MLTFLTILFIVVLVVLWVNYTSLKEMDKKPLFTATKKVEAVAKDIADVNNDGKVDTKDASAAVHKIEDAAKNVVKKARKITAKKNPKK